MARARSSIPAHPQHPPLEFATSRYAARELVVASGLAAVGITVGEPRFPLGYELADNVRMLAPFGLLSVTNEDDFTRRYRERLDMYGVEKILRVLAAIARRLEETAGSRVPELGP